MFAKTKLASGLVAGVLGVAVSGAAAFAAFQPADLQGASPVVAEQGGTATVDVVAEQAGTDQDKDNDKDKDREGPRAKIKEILDKLVANGTITQDQENKILQAFEAAADHRRDGAAHLKNIFKDMMKLSVEYLGIDRGKVEQQLKDGKTLCQIADATSGKSCQQLIATLDKGITALIDKALADGKITSEQATKAKEQLTQRINDFVNHKFERSPLPPRNKPETKPERPAPKATPSPSPTT